MLRNRINRWRCWRVLRAAMTANLRTARVRSWGRSMEAHSLSESVALETKHHARAMLLVVSVLWTSCVLVVSSSDELRGSAAYAAAVPQSGTFGSAKRAALWQLPQGPVQKLLVIFTPKSIFPVDFWQNSPGCPTCIGIPEPCKIVADAVARDYAVFVPRAKGNEWEWWPEDNPEVLLAQVMISEWKNLLGVQGLPTVSIGISAGGYILNTLSLQSGLFDATCLMLCHGVVEAMHSTTNQYPPTIFAYMPRDESMTRQVTIARSILKSRGVPTAEVTWYPHPLTSDYFSKTIAGVSLELSTAIFNCIKREGWLDEANFLNTDSYLVNWPRKAQLWNIIPESFSGYLLYTAIKFQMNLAYAQHTSFSGRDNEIFAFLDGDYASAKHGMNAISSFTVDGSVST